MAANNRKNPNTKQHKLTKWSKRFAEEYVKDLNGTRAAVRAGYSEKTAKQQAYRLLSQYEVQQAIAKQQEEISRRTQIDQDYIVNSLRAVADSCMEADKWNPQAANKSLELLGKHLGIFVEKKQHEHTFTLGQLAAELEEPDGESDE